MKLQTYMDKFNLTDADMAEKIGKDRSLISKYRRGIVVPSLDVIADIERVTSKAVSFHDFREVA